MANVFIEESTMTAIGNAIRAKTGGTAGILPEDMPAQIESISSGSSGSTDGYYDTFWDAFQKNGAAMNYLYAFAYGRFTDANYNPKYDIKCSGGTTPSRYLFYQSTEITDTKVPIYVNNNNMDYCFQGCTGLVTIRQLDVQATTGFTSTFASCSALANITITGTIGKNISFVNSSKLTHDSLMSIINALEEKTDGSTPSLTLHATAKARLSTDEIAIATQKGWSVV